jgi:sugar/nucleoside kinase (ribokinase family)
VSPPGLQVVGVGNALVDILSHEDDAFLHGTGLEKGAATMVDAAGSDALYARLGPATEVSGGSAANTVAGVASFGGSAAFVGRVGDDAFGAVFAHDLRSAGVRFDPRTAGDGTPTGRCLVVVTPDAQRTMCTYLGAACDLEPDAVDEALVGDAAVTYLEGYLWDQPLAKAAIRRAAHAAHDHGRRVALTLSDPFCVERHRAEFRTLVEGSVDVLFANEHEICSLYEVDDLDAAMHRVRGHCEIAALTRGPLGSVVVTRDDVHVVDPHPVARVVDTTGAGDLYAAGFLFGLTSGHDLAACGRLGSLAAAEVISHLGARPVQPLALLAAEALER